MYRLIALLAVVLVGCTDLDRNTIGPEFGVERAGSGELTILNWNVYYGADFEVLLDSRYEEPEAVPIPVRAAIILGQVNATDAPGRAQAIARQIAMARPHLVTMQEVPRYRLQQPGDFLLPDASGYYNPVVNAGPDDELFDFVDLLLGALQGMGATYAVAARTETLDAELPVIDPSVGYIGDLRFTESLVILRRGDVTTTNPAGSIFQYNLSVPLGDSEMVMPKGWASADITLKGRTYRVLTTHLEPADMLEDHAVHPALHQLQLAQAAEVLGVLAGAPMPVVLTGDLNSNPDGSSTDTYGMVLQAGFVDTWLVGRQRGNGFTANQPWHLQNTTSELWHRIDFVMYRDEFTASGVPFRGSVHASVVGDKPADRTLSGLWPSDHAGVLATLNTPQK